jgi:hypothetical protein
LSSAAWTLGTCTPASAETAAAEPVLFRNVRRFSPRTADFGSFDFILELLETEWGCGLLIPGR